RVIHGILESSVAVTQQRGHVGIGEVVVTDDQVKLPIAVEITRQYRNRTSMTRVKRIDAGQAEASLAVVRENRQIITAHADDREIERTIAIKVRSRHVPCVGPNGIVNGRLKGSVTVAKQDADGVRTTVAHDQVGNVVAVEVGGDDA